MSPSPPRERPPYYRKVGTTFRPRFTLSVLYLFGFFFLYCLLLVAPSLWEVLRTVPTGPEQQEAAQQVAREVIRPRLWIAVVLSAVTTILGAHYRVLPGIAPRI
jgi:ABC-type uncharacterized transport system permease subunit